MSSAGALGLMQVMPATAKKVAEKAHIDYTHQKQLFSAAKNIEIGSAFLNNLASIYNNHPILMAAAYNAGPKQVKNWLNNHKAAEIDIWIETLPWRETRNYLKNVMAFYAVYQYRMQKEPDLSPFFASF